MNRSSQPAGVSSLAVALLASGLSTFGLSGQGFERVEPDPTLPMKEGFDLDRAMIFAEPNFVPFRDAEWQSLRSVMLRDEVAGDTPVLVFEAGGQTRVLISRQMSYHHVAQGVVMGEPWMVTF